MQLGTQGRLTLKHKKREDKNLEKIRQTEELINETLWNAVRDQNNQKELQGYKEAREILKALPKLSPRLEKERSRVLSYCFMRIDNTLVATGDTKESVKRMRTALKMAQKSQDAVQIARCLLALGARLASAGFAVEAEESWNKALAVAEGKTEYDMQQVVGWTLITKASFLNRKGERMEALRILERAEKILEAINNYAGVANSNVLMAEIYRSLNDKSNEHRRREKSKEYMEKAKTEQK